MKPAKVPRDLSIPIHDEFAEYIGGPAEVVDFSLSPIDAGRLAGHLCPSVAGAYVLTRAAIGALFPENGVCQRGLLRVEMPGLETEGANGPMGHVISQITGAWGEGGFGGIRGSFVRRGLLTFGSKRVAPGRIRFERTDTGRAVEVSFHPERALEGPENPVERILASSDLVAEVHSL